MFDPAPDFHTFSSNRKRVQFFPFGRGERGSQQRLYVEFTRWGGKLQVFSVAIMVHQIVGIPSTVALVGFSTYQGKFDHIIHRVNFREARQNIAAAFRNFPVARKTNKLHRKLRKDGYYE